MSLSDYWAGDELTITGQGIEGRYHATQVESLYRAIRSRVDRRDSNDLFTSEGTLRVVGSTETTEATDDRGQRYRSKAVSDIERGDAVVAWARYEPLDGVFIVVEIAAAAGP